MAAMGAPRPNIVIPERTEPALGLAVPDVVAADVVFVAVPVVVVAGLLVVLVTATLLVVMGITGAPPLI